MDHHPWSETGSPGSRVSNFRTCTGSSDHARAEIVLANYERFHVAFRTYDAVGPPKLFYFRGSIPGPHVPLSTLSSHGYPYARMTRGQHGLLLLCYKRLSLSVTHRFSPAHRKVKIVERTHCSLKKWFERDLVGGISAESMRLMS